MNAVLKIGAKEIPRAVEKHLGHSNYKEYYCPYCSSINLKLSGACHTLVGYFGGPDEDPNHWQEGVDCLDCGKPSTKHWVPRGKNSWYTDVEFNFVIRGLPSCCEDRYLLPCWKCEGWKAHSTRLSGNGTVIYDLSSGGCVPKQPMYWKCLDCGDKTEDVRFGEEYMGDE
jgi:hypothetical protein